MSLLRAAIKTASTLTDPLHARPLGPRILIYHQVGAGLGRQMEVEVDDFRRQVDWVAANRTVVGLDEAILRWDEPGSDRLVVLTFDDGYRDTYTEAFPILRDLGLPFTLYLATESIETGVALGPVPGSEPVTWDQVGEILGTGLLTVGAHTHRHADLRMVTVTQIEEELALSDALLGARLGLTGPLHFAYPWGFWSAEAEGLVSNRYLSAALAGGVGSKPPLDPMRLPRYPVQLSDGFRWFQPRLRGGFRFEESIRRRRNRYTGP